MKGDLNMNTVVDLRKITDSIVSSTELSRKSSQILSEIEENKSSKVIIKNNKPTAVIMSISEYNKLMEVWETKKFIDDIDGVDDVDVALDGVDDVEDVDVALDGVDDVEDLGDDIF